MQTTLEQMLARMGVGCKTYGSAEEFLSAGRNTGGCVVVDIHFSDMDGITLIERLEANPAAVPALVISGHTDIEFAVRAMKAGATDVLPKPFDFESFSEKVRACLATGQRWSSQRERHREARRRLALLSPREREVLCRVIAGEQNKAIAWELGISIKTVEVHRARVMAKTGSASVVKLARLWEIADDDSSRFGLLPGLGQGAAA